MTRSSQDVPDYDRATELERLGGTLLDDAMDLEKAFNKKVILPSAV